MRIDGKTVTGSAIASTNTGSDIDGTRMSVANGACMKATGDPIDVVGLALAPTRCNGLAAPTCLDQISRFPAQLHTVISVLPMRAFPIYAVG